VDRERGVASRLARALIGESVELPGELVERFPELAGARYRRGGLPPRIGGWCLGTTTVAGITLWRTIWLAERGSWSPALLLHELRHVHQFEVTFGFPFRYIWETFRRGYHQNRFEVDARRFAAVRLQSPVRGTPLGTDAPSLSEDA
jgi:hypothetical protein